MSNPEDKKQEQPELKATNYEMIPTEQIPIADPNQIFLMNPELTPDSIPPAQLVAMNGIFFLLIKNPENPINKKKKNNIWAWMGRVYEYFNIVIFGRKGIFLFFFFTKKANFFCFSKKNNSFDTPKRKFLKRPTPCKKAANPRVWSRSSFSVPDATKSSWRRSRRETEMEPIFSVACYVPAGVFWVVVWSPVSSRIAGIPCIIAANATMNSGCFLSWPFLKKRAFFVKFS